jgi:hypothetical protein
MKALSSLGVDKPGVAHEDLTQVRTRVRGYAGLADPMARRLSDQYLRAWAGETLAGLRERAEIPDAVRERLDDAILRCELGDQRLLVEFEQHGALARPEAQAHLAAADAAMVAAVDAALSAPDHEALAKAVDAVRAAYDARIATATGPGGGTTG